MKNSIIFLIASMFLSCSNNLSDKEAKEYILKGKKISQEVLKELGGNLTQQMKNGGVKQALPFCNIAAIPLTNELAKKHQVSIKRTSNKLRNLKNKPTLDEEKALKQFIKSIEKGDKIKPIIRKDGNNKIHFYAPILTQKKCLACHGVVSKKTDSIIKSYYPKDMAINFKTNDLRGIISISF